MIFLPHDIGDFRPQGACQIHRLFVHLFDLAFALLDEILAADAAHGRNRRRSFNRVHRGGRTRHHHLFVQCLHGVDGLGIIRHQVNHLLARLAGQIFQFDGRIRNRGHGFGNGRFHQIDFFVQ